MPLDDALRFAAERNGVQQDFWDIFGRRHFTTTETNRAILTALGFDCSTEETLRNSLAERDRINERRLLPSVLVVSENERLRIPLISEPGTFDLEIVTEQGAHQCVRIENGAAPSELTLPLGYHEASVSHSKPGGACTMRLIVTGADRVPPAGARQARRAWHHTLRSPLGAQLGSGRFPRSPRSDRLGRPDASRGFHRAQSAPCHPPNRRPYNTSPYLPNSIYYRNFLYLDVEAVPGFDGIRHRFADRETCTELARLRASPIVEYEQVAALKRRALDLIFAANPPSRDCKKWIEAEGDLLRLYATYCALDEHLHAEDPNLWVWPDWPEPYRDPASDAVRQFAAKHRREILFHGWLQWNVDQQLAGVQQHAHLAGMGIGLYHDLALATDPLRKRPLGPQELLHSRMLGGLSPPTISRRPGRTGLSLPPDSRQHRENGYRLYNESIRKSLQHGGALRIDHVMRLFRLYWIPEGHDAALRQGHTFGTSPATLCAFWLLKARASQRGDRGGRFPVPLEPEVRETLARFGILLSYRLLHFERDFEHNAGRFRSPAEYPEQALASSTTHDLATITGFWTSNDNEARFHAGNHRSSRLRSPETGPRNAINRTLLDALPCCWSATLRLHKPERTRFRNPTGELHYAIIGYLASTSSVLWLVNQEAT